jgi:hypothetical protein
MSEVAHLGATQPVHLRDRVDRRDCAPQTARPCTPAAIAIGLADQSSALGLFERVATIRSIISGRIVFTTSFGLEDQAIAHVIFSQALAIDVATLDTGRLFPETHEVWAETEHRYDTRILAFAPEHVSVEALIARQGIDGLRSSVAARHDCCAIRKIAPLARVLDGSAAWVTGIRADQSADRAQFAPASFEEGRQLIKSIRCSIGRANGRSNSYARTTFPTTPCMTAASCRSVALPAHVRFRRASRSVQGAGGGSRRRKRNAACTSPEMAVSRARNPGRLEPGILHRTDHGGFLFSDGSCQ